VCAGSAPGRRDQAFDQQERAGPGLPVVVATLRLDTRSNGRGGWSSRTSARRCSVRGCAGVPAEAASASRTISSMGLERPCHRGPVPLVAELGTGTDERIGDAGELYRGRPAQLLVQPGCRGGQDCGPLWLALKESQIGQKIQSHVHICVDHQHGRYRSLAVSRARTDTAVTLLLSRRRQTYAAFPHTLDVTTQWTRDGDEVPHPGSAAAAPAGQYRCRRRRHLRQVGEHHHGQAAKRVPRRLCPVVEIASTK
jgi:hypothetical protein